MIELTEKIGEVAEPDETLTLAYELRQKSRQRVRLDSGREAAVVLPPGTHLDDGDRLRGADGTTVRVAAAPEPVTTARADDPLRLARACYHLGNRHVALEIGAGWVRYQPDHVLDEMVRRLGLTLIHESAPFRPERGAYHGGSGAADDRHSHRHDGADHVHGHRH